MKPLLLVSILSLLSTSVWAQEPPAIELTGVKYLEAGAKMYRKVGQAGYEIGDVVRLKDEKNVNITRKALMPIS